MIHFGVSVQWIGWMVQNRGMSTTSLRQRFRADVQAQIIAAAHAQMISEGAEAISLRAIARQLGMAPSAVHGYFASRDDLLTALMIRQFNALGQVLDAAEQGVRNRSDYRARVTALFLAERQFALSEPPTWSLLFGGPVPGYSEPAEVCDTAQHFVRLIVTIIEDATSAGIVFKQPASAWEPAPAALTDQPVGDAAALMSVMPAWQVATGLAAYSWMVGAITAELRQMFAYFVSDYDAQYRAGVAHWVDAIGM